MGSGNSRLDGAPPPTTPKVNRTKHRFSSLFCGSSSSSSSQREDRVGESLVNSTDSCQQLADESQSSSNLSISTFTGETEFTSHLNISTSSGTSASPESNSRSIDEVRSGNDSHIGSSSNRKCYSESDKIVSNDTPSFFEEIEELAIPVVSGPGITSQLRGDEAVQEVETPGSGLLGSEIDQARTGGSLLHVDVVSVSSNVLPSNSNEVSTREARRNSRRMFWDAFSSRSSRRHAEYPALLLTTEDAEFTGSRRRWLLDIGDDILDDGFGTESLHLGRRTRFTTDRRRNSRTEIRSHEIFRVESSLPTRWELFRNFWDRLRGAATESTHRSSCPLDLHSDGSCTCELDQEASALSSISRIVLLAEALFEVLDEIHQQPDSFSLSVLSVPAPESVVDSLPLRTYEKPCTAGCGEDVDQCYICLVEYEEGDKIRVLPCRHEYHMSCVDKWLKEIHGICPLCRGEVRGEVVLGEDTTTSTSDAVVT